MCQCIQEVQSRDSQIHDFLNVPDWVPHSFNAQF